MIYWLQDPELSGKPATSFLPLAPDNVGEAPRCLACNRFVGMLRWLPPFRAELDVTARRFGDVVFGPGDSLLVSERFAALWRREKLVGLEGFESVEIVRVHRRLKMEHGPPRYLHASVVRSAACVDAVQSAVEWGRAPWCQICRMGDDLKGWGSIVLEAPAPENLFMARGLPGLRLADDRFRLFCEEHQIQSVCLVPGPEAGYRFQGRRDRPV